MRRLPFVASLALPIMMLTGCTTALSREELLKEMREGHPPLIVDVRSRAEYDRGHLPGAVPIPFTAIRSGLEENEAAKGERIVIYCEHGPRAGIAGILLALSGYDKVFSLQGHMKAWRENRFPIETFMHSSHDE
jgi:rhodanese-related sulfurtransferase